MPVDGVDYQGRWVQVDDDVAHVVREIERLWPELRVQYCENPDIGDAPYRIVEHRNGADYDVMSVWALDNRLLETLHQADSTKHDIMSIMDKTNALAKKRREGELLYWKDYVHDVLRSASRHMGSSFSFKDPREGHEGEIVTIEDDPSHRGYKVT